MYPPVSLGGIPYRTTVDKGNPTIKKAKKYKKVTPRPSEMLKLLKFTTPHQNFQLFFEIFLKKN
jgi:hypothetical protein